VTKSLSVRLDETAVETLNRVSRRLGITKKQFLEEAIHQQASRVTLGESFDVWEETCGAWKRQESPRTTIRRARQALEASMMRHHRSQKHA
jgi:predicted transcriptional regulator